jgi:uncharacterized protein (TIGR02117 family)
MGDRQGRGWRLAWRALLILVGVPLLLLAGATLILGLLPANAGWVEAARGITIFVADNGVHTGIAVPLRNAVMDWRGLVPASDLQQPAEGDYVLIGFGDRDFYLETPSWSALSPGTAFNAAFGGGEAVLHVEHLATPREDDEFRAVTLTPDEYRWLADYIQAQFRRDGTGRTIVIPGRGYGGNDAFYEADGGFSLIANCNEWTGRALRAAGVRMGLWTPLAQGVSWRLPRHR